MRSLFTYINAEINAAEIVFSEDEIKDILYFKISHKNVPESLLGSVRKFRTFKDELNHEIIYALRARLKRLDQQYLLQYKMILGKMGDDSRSFSDDEINILREGLQTIFDENEISCGNINIKVTNNAVKSLMYSILKKKFIEMGFRNLGFYVYYSMQNEYSSSKIFRIYRGLEIRCTHMMNKLFILVRPKVVVDSCTFEELINYVDTKYLYNLYCKALRFDAIKEEIFRQGIIREIDMNNMHATIEFGDGAILKIPFSNIKLLGRFEYYKHILNIVGESYKDLQQTKRELAYSIGYKEFERLRGKGKYAKDTLAEEYYHESLKLLKMISELIDDTYLNNVKIHIEPSFIKVD